MKFQMFISRSVFLARKAHFMNNKSDPELNFYQNVSNVEANYFLMTEVKSCLTSLDPSAFSVLCLNIRSMKKKIKNFKRFLKNFSVSFTAVFPFETWLECHEESQNSDYISSRYKCFYKYRQHSRGRSVLFFVKVSLWKYII